MTPTLTDLTRVETAVAGYCDIHGIPIMITHDRSLLDNCFTRFRIADQLNDSVVIRWVDASYNLLDDTINNVCRGIYNDWKRLKPDQIDISKELELLQHLRYDNSKPTIPEIKNVIFNPPCTIVLWSDNTKTVVKCQEGDTFDPEKGLAMAIVKKLYGNTGKYCEIFKKWVPEVECEYPNIMINLDCSGDSFVRALEKIREAAKRTTMSQQEALNSLYGKPKKVDSEWTPTAQDKPTKNGEYLVYDKFTDSVYVYEYCPTCDKDVSYWRNYITHWMPCPKAPVEKKG